MNFTPHAKPQVALNVVRAIDQAIELDGGKLYKQLLRKYVAEAEDAYKVDPSPFRKHLGASEIGEKCHRLLWYKFHWAAREYIPPRLTLLLNRGHLEEARFLALMEMIGYLVRSKDSSGKQYKLSACGGMFGGSCDGLFSLPGLLDSYVSEFKTHCRSSFEDLAGPLKEWRAFKDGIAGAHFTGKGVRASKVKHYAQSQTYIAGFNAAGGLYLAVCKDTDDLYAEWIPPDQGVAASCMAVAASVVGSAVPPPKINENPGWFECRFCIAKGICHNGRAPERNCRTCRHGKPAQDGMWWCFLPINDAPYTRNEAQQLTGCAEHSYIVEIAPK
jgi:hypothetical protein